jgi:hypothetical protein
MQVGEEKGSETVDERRGHEGEAVDDQAGNDAVADKQAITERIHQYCYAVDLYDRELGQSLWHPDGTVTFEGVFDGLGRDYFDWHSQFKDSGVVTSHNVTNVLIQLEGDRATSTAYVHSCTRVGDTDHVMWGRYDDTWSRREGQWRFDSRRFTLALSQSFPVADQAPLIG